MAKSRYDELMAQAQALNNPKPEAKSTKQSVNTTPVAKSSGNTSGGKSGSVYDNLMRQAQSLSQPQPYPVMLTKTPAEIAMERLTGQTSTPTAPTWQPGALERQTQAANFGADLAKNYSGPLSAVLNKADGRTSILDALNGEEAAKAAMVEGYVPKKSPYAEYLTRADYAEKSQAGERKRSRFIGGDALYDYINDIDGYRQAADVAQARGMGKEYGKYSFMTEDEIGVYNYLYATEGKKAAQRFLKELEPSLNQQWYSGASDNIVEMSREHPVLASGATVLAQPVRAATGIAAGVEDAFRTATGQGIDPYSDLRTLSRMTSDVREAIAKDIEQSPGIIGSAMEAQARQQAEQLRINWELQHPGADPAENPFATAAESITPESTGKAAAFAYQTAMSAADSAVNMYMAQGIASGYADIKGLDLATKAGTDALMKATNQIGSLAMSSEVMSLGVAEAKEKGYSDAGALTVGMIRGAVEYASEAIGGEWTIKLIKKNPLNFVNSMVRNMIPEGVEEVMSDAMNGIINLVMDEAFGTNESGITALMQDFSTEGWQERHPTIAAIFEQAKKIGVEFDPRTATFLALLGEESLSFLGGALATVGSSGVQTYNIRQGIGATAQRLGTTQEGVAKLMEDYKTENPGDIYELAQFYDAQNEEELRAKAGTDKTAEQILEATETERKEKKQKAAESAASTNAVTNRFRGLGTELTEAEADATGEQRVAQAVQNMDLADASETQQKMLVDAFHIGTAGAEEYVPAMNEAFRLGSMGVSLEQARANRKETTLTDRQFETAWKIGSLNPRVDARSARATLDGKETTFSLRQNEDTTEAVFTDSEGNTTSMPLDEALTSDRVELGENASTAIRQMRALGKDAAGAFAVYDGSMSAASYANAMGDAIHVFAANGADLKTVAANMRSQGVTSGVAALSDAQLEFAQQAGNRTLENEKTASERRSESLAQKPKAPKGKRGRVLTKGAVAQDGKTYKGIDTKSLNREQRAVVETVGRLSRVMPLNYVIFDGDARAEQGFYERSTGTVWININAGGGETMAALGTLTHEITHSLQQYAPAQYEALKNEITKIYFENDPAKFQELVHRRMEMGGTSRLTEAEATDEVIANSCMRMLGDTNAIEQVVADDQTLAKKILSTIKQKINEILGKMKTLYGEDRFYQEHKAEFEKARQLWADAFAAAAENVQRETSVESGVQYQRVTDKNDSIRIQVQKAQNRLNAMDVAAKINVDSVPRGVDKATRWAMDRMSNTGFQTERQNFGTIIFDETHIREALRHITNHPDEMGAVLALPRVLKRGIIIEQHDQHKGRVQASYTIAAPIEVNGIRGNMAVIVHRTTRNFYHAHRVLLPGGSNFTFDENYKADSKRTGELPGDRALIAESVESASENTITENGINVKKQEEVKEFPTKNKIYYQLLPVDEVEPSGDEWKRTATTEEAMQAYPNLWNVAAEESETRNPTQIASTQGTYRKIYNILKNDGFTGRILDASSGMGIGTQIGREEFGFDVDDIEPYPDKSYRPKYTDYSKLDEKYDAIISSAVLNVLPQDQRDALVVKMGQLLNPGGKMYITTRGRDVDSLAKTGKNIHLGPMEWIETVKGSYQKGFTQGELIAYLRDALGDGFTVEGSNKSNGGKFNNNTSVVVTKAGGDQNRTQFQMLDPTEETDRLVAVHNKSVSGLKRMLTRGGVPFPSIAVKKAGTPHEGFGDVSIVFPRSTIDPQVNRQNRLYSNDAWTPTEPRTEYDVGDMWRYMKKLRKAMGDEVYDGLKAGSYLEENDVARKLTSNNGDIFETLKDVAALKYAYLQSIGQTPTLPQRAARLDGFGKYTNDQMLAVFDALGGETGVERLDYDNAEALQTVADTLNGQFLEKIQDPAKRERIANNSKLLPYSVEKINPNIIRDAWRKYAGNGKSISAEVDFNEFERQMRQNDSVLSDPGYREWIESYFSDLIKDEGIPNGKDIYTDSGNRRSFRQRHVPATLENIVQQMRKEQERGVGMMGINLRGAATKSYSTVEEMRADRGRLLGERITDEVYDSYMHDFHERLHQLSTRGSMHPDDWSSLDSTEEMLLEAVRDAKTKTQMANILRRESRWLKYSPELVNDLWQLRNDVQNMPAPYFEAKPRRTVYPEEALAYIVPDNADSAVVSELERRGYNVMTYKAGDEQDRLAKLNSVEGAQFQMFDSDGVELSPAQQAYFGQSKARNADGSLLRLYHGTQSYGFTVFDPSFSDDRRSLFMTDNLEMAQSYSNTYEVRSAVTAKSAAEMTGEELIQALNRAHPGRYGIVYNNELRGYSDYLNEWIGQQAADAKADLAVLDKLKGIVSAQYLENARKELQAVAAWDPAKPWRTEHALNRIPSPSGQAEDSYTFGIAYNLSYYTGEDGVDIPEFKSVDVPGVLRNLWELQAANDAAARNEDMYYKRDGFASGQSQFYSLEDLRVIADAEGALSSGNYPLYANIVNPLEIDAKGGNWDNIPFRLDSGETVTWTTRELAEYADRHGNDGVIIRNVHDNGGRSRHAPGAGTVVIAFRGDQIKDVENKMPTANPDIRYQMWDNGSDDTADEKRGRTQARSRMQEESQLLHETIYALNRELEKLRGQANVTESAEVSADDARKLARKYLKSYDSTADAEGIAAKIKALGDYIVSAEEISEEQARAMAMDIARELIDNAREVEAEYSAAAEYQEIADEIRGKKFNLSEQDRGELDMAGGYNAFRRANFGRFILGEGGDRIDTYYEELQQRFGTANFPEVNSQGEMLMVMADIFDRARPEMVNPYEGFYSEAVSSAANDILYDALGEDLRQKAPSLADRIAGAREHARHENTETAQEELKKAEKELRQLRKGLDKAQEKVNAAQTAVEDLEKDQAIVRAGLEQSESDVRRLRSALENARANNEDLTGKRAELQAQLAQSEKNRDNLQKALERAQKRTDDARAERSQARKTVLEQQNRINALEKRLARTQQRAEQQLSQATEKGLARLEALRAEKNARIAEVRQQGAARAQEVRAQEKAAKWAKVAEIQNYYREREAQARERRNEAATMRQYRKRIAQLYNEFAREIQHPTETKHVPPQLLRQAAEILSALNMDNSREGSRAGARLRERLANLKLAYDAIEKDQDFRTRAVYDPMISEMMQRMAEEVGDTPINRMNVRQLELVYNVLKAMKKTASTALKVQLGNEERDAYQLSVQMTNETRSSPNRVGRGPVARWLNSMLSPERMFKRLGGNHKNSTWLKVYQMLNAGQLKGTQIQVEGSRIFESLLKGKAYEDFVNPKKTVDVGLTDEDGNTIELTHGMMVSLYMHMQNEDNARHAVFGGLKVPSLKDYYNGRKTKGSENAVRVGGTAIESVKKMRELQQQLKEAGSAAETADIQAQIDAAREEAMEFAEKLSGSIEEQLTDYDRQWIRALHELMDVYSRDRLNETTLEVYGIKKAGVDNYWPIWVDGNFLNTPFESVARDFSIENAGFMKERVESSKPILLADASEVASSQLRKVAQYCGLMPAIRDFNKIWGKVQSGYTDSLKAAVEKVFGKTGMEYVERVMADLNGSRSVDSGLGGEVLGRLRGNMAQASLTLSMRVALGQTASYPTAAAVVGWKALGKALVRGGRSNTLISRADQALIEKYSPLLAYRMKGYSTVELGDIADTNSRQNRIWKKMRWLTGWIQAMDGATVGRLWYAAEYYVQDHNKALEKGTDAYYQEVAKVFNDIVEKTQPDYTTLQRPDILRNPNAIMRSLTMFMTQRLQNFNIVFDAAADYTQAKRDYAAGRFDVTKEDVHQAAVATRRAVISQIVAGATITAFKFAADALLHNMNAYRDDDKELTEESVGLELLDMFLDSVMGNFLWGSELYDLVETYAFGKTYYGVEVSGVSSVTDTIESVNNLITEVVENGTSGEKFTKKLNAFAKNLASALGIPLGNAEKIILGVMYHAQDIANGEFGSFDAGVSWLSKSKEGKWRENLESLGVTQRQFAQFLKEAETNGNSGLTQDEAGTWLNKQLEAGSITMDMANAYWAASVNGKKTFAEWRSKGSGKPAAASAPAAQSTPAAATTVQTKPVTSTKPTATAPATKPSGTTYKDFQATAPIYGSAKRDAAYAVWRDDLQGSGMSLDRFTEILTTADADGNSSLKQAELGAALRKAIRTGEMTEEQAARLWDTQGWKTSFQKWNSK